MNQSYSYTHAAHQNTTQSFMIASGGGFTFPAESTSVEYIGSTATPVTMSSLEIAELTGKQHRNVLADIRSMLEELDFSTADFSAVYTAANGQQYEAFNLPRDLTQTLITGYSVPLRHRVVQRLNDLESKVVKPLLALSDAPNLQGFLLAFTEQMLHLGERIREDAVKVEFYNDMADTEKLFNAAVVSKGLGTGRTRLLHYLRKHKILMGSGNKMNLPYQKHLDAGRFEAKWITCKDRETGNRKLKPIPLFTGKGIIWLQQFIEQNGREGL